MYKRVLRSAAVIDAVVGSGVCVAGCVLGFWAPMAAGSPSMAAARSVFERRVTIVLRVVWVKLAWELASGIYVEYAAGSRVAARLRGFARCPSLSAMRIETLAV